MYLEDLNVTKEHSMPFLFLGFQFLLIIGIRICFWCGLGSGLGLELGLGLGLEFDFSNILKWVEIIFVLKFGFRFVLG